MDIKRYKMGAALGCCLFVATTAAYATPPFYKTFERDQKVQYSPKKEELLRIWILDVDQGDGILIQLPSKYGYQPDPESEPERREQIEILVDGGSSPSTEATRTYAFIKTLYPDETLLEYAVITHHDADHVRGMINVLNSDDTLVERIFHNGLASYRPGKKGFPETGKVANVIATYNKQRLTRGMAFLNPDKTLKQEYLIKDIKALKKERRAENLQGIYEELATAVIDNDVVSFDRAHSDSSFINEAEARSDRGINLDEIKFKLIWPLKKLKKYNNWGETINGNSLTFSMQYGDFSMLFTGDLNEHSEKALVQHLEKENKSALLNCDVLKVPHHGSAHAFDGFFNHQDMKPVISVASMGQRGFKSKKLGSRNWQHPDTEVIKWLGGFHRVYHTYIHEKFFKWENLDSDAKHDKLIERRHILIETDGKWFRVVEVENNEQINHPPSVRDTRRGNGTRWIRASVEGE